MARNVEIKAQLAEPAAVLARALQRAAGPAQQLVQDDTFFNCPQGRLKLREFAAPLSDVSARPGPDTTAALEDLASGPVAELIHYQRADGVAARLSDYVRCPVSDPAALREALTRAWGLRGRVQKVRQLLQVGQTRVHIDQVQGLGAFIELEVVLREHQTPDEGAAIAEALMHDLGLGDAPRVAVAYLDLLQAGTASTA